MKASFITIVFLCIFITEGICQNKYPVPKGYSIYKDSENKPARLDKDLDNDGINDLVIVCAKNNSETDNIVAVYLSTKHNNSRPFHSFPLSASAYNFEMKNKVLTIGCCADSTYCRSLKFKFYPALKNLRLIGYEERSKGSGNNDAYVKSVNMLTQKYELSGPQWKKKIRVQGHFSIITLSDIDEATLERFETIGFKYF